jgi:hypothetical protein
MKGDRYEPEDYRRIKVGVSPAALAVGFSLVQAPAMARTAAEASAAQALAQPVATTAGARSVQGSTIQIAQAPDPSRAYADQYTTWTQQNCVDERTGNIAAGAIIGGALGAIAGSALSHGHTSVTLAGGAVGAVAGAEIGATSSNCPPGYKVRAGAPVFVYDGPYPTTEVVYKLGLYHPWVWVDSHWAYVPYGHWAPAYWARQPRVIYRHY